MTILVTGANGQTGRAVIRALAAAGEGVRALAFRDDHLSELRALGAAEVVVGDMRDRTAMDAAFTGTRTAYHICSALNPDEVTIGRTALDAARAAGTEHFVYHSVLHPVLQELPHHQKKLHVEQLVVSSGIPYTIVQPAVLMQNVLEGWRSIVEDGIFEQRFFAADDIRINMVDLQDVAEAAATVVTTSGHSGATYELCGPENLALTDVLREFARHLGRSVIARTTPAERWAADLRAHGVGAYQVDTLTTMFRHYNEHGFAGNPHVLTWILGRRPTDFGTFVQRTVQADT